MHATSMHATSRLHTPHTVLYVDRFAAEARRVLKPGGALITDIEVARSRSESDKCPNGCGYSVRNTFLDYANMRAVFARELTLAEEHTIGRNETHLLVWTKAL